MQNYHIAINASAIGSGSAEIDLLAIFNYPSPYQKIEKKLTEKINILDSLAHKIIPFIRKSESMNSLLLLTPKSEYQLKFNKDITKVIILFISNTNQIDIFLV